MERDDVVEYSLYNHHDEETGRKIRKKLWGVFWLLLVVTIVEVFIGFKFGRSESLKGVIMVTFIALTILKAYYIVMTFMHLGDETKSFKIVVLVPYLAFVINMLFMIFDEAEYTNRMGKLFNVSKVEENTSAPAPSHGTEH